MQNESKFTLRECIDSFHILIIDENSHTQEPLLLILSSQLRLLIIAPSSSTVIDAFFESFFALLPMAIADDRIFYGYLYCLVSRSTTR